MGLLSTMGWVSLNGAEHEIVEISVLLENVNYIKKHDNDTCLLVLNGLCGNALHVDIPYKQM